MNDFDQDAPDEQPEAAFERAAAGYEWRGKPLPFAYTTQRADVARKLGMMYPFVPDSLMFEFPNPRKQLLGDTRDAKQTIQMVAKRERKTVEQIRAEIEAEDATSSMYDMTNDAAILLWLCHQDIPTLFSIQRAFDRAQKKDDWTLFDEWKSKLYEWADTHKIKGALDRDGATFMQIITDDINTESSPKPREKPESSGAESPNASAPRARRGSSAKSRLAAAGR